MLKGDEKMSNPCGTTKANILEKTDVKGIPVYFGTGVNPSIPQLNFL